eukprot:PITA_17944
MLLKIDLSKAFDSLSWVYIQKILNAFSFDPAWIRWVFSLLSSSFFSALINGIPSPTFRPSRGIRKHAFSKLSFRTSPKLQKPILIVSSQNFFFNTPVPTQNAIAHILGFTIASLPSKCLRAPLMASSLKHSSWKVLVERLEARLLLWTHKAFNMVSRLVLIKVVLHSMPLYIFSILAAPKWVLKEIKKLQRNFLWGNSSPNRKWALVKWDKVCLPKKAGGIGLRDLGHRNAVMGAKIWWRWLSNPNTPWASLWTAKYANNNPLEEIIRISEASSGSVIWNSANQRRNLIQQHSFWEIKNGTTARF